MQRFLSLLFCLPVLGLFSGCGTFHLPESGMTASKVTTDRPVEGRPSSGLPITLPNQAVVMVPFLLEHEKRWFEKRDHYGKSRSGTYYDEGVPIPVRWNNVLFHHLETDADWMLLERRAVISSYAMPGPVEFRPEPQPPKHHPEVLLFRVTEQDTDGDRALTRLDVSVAYAADPDGRNPRRITPADADCLSWRYDPDHKLVFLHVRPDSNGDGKHDALDESSPWRFAPGDERARPLLSSDIVARAQRLLQE